MKRAPRIEAKKLIPPVGGQVTQKIFGVNEIRLNLREWLITAVMVFLIIELTPRIWVHLERFDIGPDYRIPYKLSKDYWLYERRMERLKDPHSVVVVGDSVVWGEYVLPNGTLSHFLNREAGTTNRFINGGVNGLFPLALEGLIRYYGKAIRDRDVILHLNLLWMSSPKADLQVHKEQKFNHPELVPQFFPRIPCYKANANERLENVIERESDFLGWVAHLQNAYFDQKSLLQWTLADNGKYPPQYPDTYKDPLAQITFVVPPPPKTDPLRGPDSPRHKPWSTTGHGTTDFEWVDLHTSLQWAAFQRLTRLLLARENHLLIVAGPFNEHMLTADNRRVFRQRLDTAVAWLKAHGLPVVVPRLLPSKLYADASHPLTQGYALLAHEIYTDPVFQSWFRQDYGRQAAPTTRAHPVGRESHL